MRILALDHGTVRIGVALSDEMQVFAQPLELIPATPFIEFIARVKTLVKEKEVELILVGMPRNMDGSYGPAAQRVREFVIALKEAVPMPIRTWDERLTSVTANRLLSEGNVRGEDRKAKVDKVAAAVLLQSYLDSITQS
jgi:putative Holliday junction resolvase